MATKNATAAANKGTEPGLPGASFPAETNAAQDPARGAQDAPKAASLGEPRPDVPDAPRGLVGISARDTCAKIKVVLQRALVQGRDHPEAFGAAEREVSLVATRNLHPAVAAYKAEALDWLRGKRGA